jgi:hypothetical protein
MLATLVAARATAQDAAPRCTPPCRMGFLCSEGQCVSACNPPCLASEVCMPGGECVLRDDAVDPETVRRHDGFFLRLGLGLGYLAGDVTNHKYDSSLATPDGQQPTEGSLEGVAQLGEFLLGGTVAPGLVLGGGVWGTNVFSPSYDGTGRDLATKELGDSKTDLELTSTSQIGPFIAFYPDPTAGAHAVLAPTLAVALVGGDRRDVKYDVPGADGVGWGLVLAAGYDFWIGEQWSLGALARCQYVSVTLGSMEPPGSFTALTPGLLFTATHH